MTELVGLDAVNMGLVKLLGIVVESANGDEVVLSMRIGPDHLQNAGIVHGGVHCALVESAASIGAYLWFNGQPGGGGRVAGVNNNTDFLRSSTGGRVTAIATPIHRGRTQQLWLVLVADADGKALARGQVRLHNFPA